MRFNWVLIIINKSDQLEIIIYFLSILSLGKNRNKLIQNIV